MIVSINIDSDVYEAVSKLSKVENRNFSNQVETILKEYFKKKQEKRVDKNE